MCNVVTINYVTCSVDEVSEMGSKFPDPDAVGGRACGETARVVAVDVGVFVVAQAVDFVCDGLVNAGC